MKSIVEQASSIIKAIEKAWQQAGKPHEFSVKIFEESQKNFIGLTTKQAKIALFFEEEKIKIKEKRRERPPVKQARPLQKPAVEQKQPKPEIKTEKLRVDRVFWTDDMVQSAEKWVQEVLRSIGLSDKTFTTEVKRYYLKFNFDYPVLEDKNKETMLFKSFAHLIMQTLRNTYKKSFPGQKIILNS